MKNSQEEIQAQATILILAALNNQIISYNRDGWVADQRSMRQYIADRADAIAHPKDGKMQLLGAMPQKVHNWLRQQKFDGSMEVMGNYELMRHLAKTEQMSYLKDMPQLLEKGK